MHPVKVRDCNRIQQIDEIVGRQAFPRAGVGQQTQKTLSVYWLVAQRDTQVEDVELVVFGYEDGEKGLFLKKKKRGQPGMQLLSPLACFWGSPGNVVTMARSQ